LAVTLELTDNMFTRRDGGNFSRKREQQTLLRTDLMVNTLEKEHS
jgi:hypothetical protein